jgi:hypothetical protein
MVVGKQPVAHSGCGQSTSHLSAAPTKPSCNCAVCLQVKYGERFKVVGNQPATLQM